MLADTTKQEGFWNSTLNFPTAIFNPRRKNYGKLLCFFSNCSRTFRRMESELTQHHGWIAKKLRKKILLQCHCQTLIEKIDGCNYVKCPCGVEWCWECRQVKYLVCNNKDHNSHYHGFRMVHPLRKRRWTPSSGQLRGRILWLLQSLRWRMLV